ncbi:unnamed protein product, partial [Mesorhabditis belari]|uniref:Uncharacterized protein n=1 Tax=Mesorhabditis belari TaxID=2138241 RepID=A0AAF3EZF7_9BILA
MTGGRLETSCDEGEKSSSKRRPFTGYKWYPENMRVPGPLVRSSSRRSAELIWDSDATDSEEYDRSTSISTPRSLIPMTTTRRITAAIGIGPIRRRVQEAHRLCVLMIPPLVSFDC